MRVKMRSTTPIRAVRAGNEAAHLRHQHNEGDLPHIGRFTGHIRAGQNGNAVRAAVERRVVRDEQRILEHLLHDGMAAVRDVQLAGEVDLRAAVILPGGQRRKIRQRVQRGHGARRALDAGGLVGQMLAHLREQLIFQRRDAVLCRQDRALELLELRGDIAFARCERLLADVGLRDLGRLAL